MSLWSVRAHFKEKLRSRERVFGAWTSLAHPSITEIFARMGVDFIGIDIEHSTINQGEAQRIIAAAQAAGVACLPRIATHNPEAIKRFLDSGADGIIAPMVSTPAEVEALISWMQYPPRGKRSYGISRAQGYGFDFQENAQTWNESAVFIIQIESIEGVNQLEKLLSYDEVDGVMIGPYDLSGTLGVPGQLDHPLVRDACQRVRLMCEKKGKALGTQIADPTPDNVARAFDDGFTFVVLASDIFLLWKWTEKMQTLISSAVEITPAAGSV